MAPTASQSSKHHFKHWVQGALQATPILLGYLPIGFAFGVLSQKAGLSPFNTLFMSLIVYAGSSQLIVVGLIAVGVTPLSIILTTFVVNLRHMLMSAALTPHLNKWPKWALAGFAFELTDESFALHATRFVEKAAERAETFAVNITAHAAWILGTWLGVVAGGLITDIEPFALDYALPAMFIALLVMQIKKNAQIFAALLAGGLSVGLYLYGWGQWYVIIATIIGASFGVLVEKWIKN